MKHSAHALACPTPSTIGRSDAVEGGGLDAIREFTFHAALDETFRVGRGPSGTRTVGAIGEGWVKGDRINGRLVGPGADWAVLGTDGYAQIDVRTQVHTDDGADVFIQYNGSLELTEPVVAALLGDGETNFGENYWFTHVRLESGAAQYQWVNRTIFVGHGRATPDGVEYEIYRLA